MPTLPSLYTNVEDLTDDLSEFITTPLVRQITGGIHVNDALIQDAWDSLPSEWTTYWDANPHQDHRIMQQDMIDSIDEDKSASLDVPPRVSEARYSKPNSPPQSLHDWLNKLKSVSLPRAQRHGPMLALPEELTGPMKTKKINEVCVAAAYIHNVCSENNITHIVDMGSGQGYLSVTLARLFPSLRILAIDGSESQVAGSEAFAASVGVSDDRLKHIVRYIDGSMALIADIDAWAGGQNCMLIGLHACGSLSEHMLRYFINCSSISHLAAVGCCYNHIVMRSESCPDGFPISDRLRTRHVMLSPTALMTGCQAPNNWERLDLTKEKSNYSKKQFYRALLEKLLHDKQMNVGGQDRPNWGIRKGDLVSFEKFTRRAMHCLGLDQAKISNQDILDYETRYANQKHRIAILWTLSVLCCKAVESIISLDRYWFLMENAATKVDIVPIFEYRISPRNLMVVAAKQN
ncbi:methyltransferase domain-domain-containing protein [Coniella lustricola]|uniref:Methyltransferase domain-domain-containing protein n=1 Tax=Coniella lustricola TaxID=2025994 RepID=A0A2T3AB92_9PEZI|nr:methyltransferase domain-domain-containing protein [Coniella lustricola]